MEDVTWHKSSHSGKQGNCVEVGWHKSSHSSSNGACVSVYKPERPHGDVLVRDTKGGIYSPILRFTPDEWTAFLAGVRDGEFDL